jgi:putative peptidoglycan lipid II flippase
MTYKALLAYSFGLIFVAGVRLVTQGFYATKNTKLPVIFGAYNLGVNFLLCYILGFGLALASSISSIFLFCILIFKLKTLIDGIKILDFFKYLILILTISGASLFLGLRTSEFITQGNSLSFGLITTILSSAIFFYTISRVLRLKELRMIFK